MQPDQVLLLIFNNRYGIEKGSDNLDCAFETFIQGSGKVNGFWILVNAQLCQNLLANNDIMHCSELVVVDGIQYDVYSMNVCTVRILRRCVLGGGYRGMR